MTELLRGIIPNVMDKIPAFFNAIRETLVMLGWSGSIAFVLGLLSLRSQSREEFWKISSFIRCWIS
jgi:ABC-type methionine transport system permease subunit